MQSVPKYFGYVAAVTVVLGSLAAGYAYRGISTEAPVSQAVAATHSPLQAAVSPGIMLPDFAGIAAQQGPAVVNISVSGTSKMGYSHTPDSGSGDPFEEFFRRFQPSIPHGDLPTRGMGSGFIVSADGVILTNAHVVADADEVTVKLTDRREFKAKVKGYDKLSDVAVLKIEAKDLPVVKIGDPQQARVGEWVIAIGSPFGFESTVTAGIISAKSRSLPDEGYVPFLQTDVAVNPGNSGGPLFNMNGEVIGINSQIYSRSGGYQGLSFAIPIDVAMKVERELLDKGKVSRGRLGVMIQEVNQQLADTFGLAKPAGALVSSVERNSPAEQAGIEPGDVILKFNGKDIQSSSELPPLVSALTPGSVAKLEIWRKGKSKLVSVNVAEMKVVADETRAEPGKGGMGLAVRPLTPQERKDADIGEGVLVEDVAAGPAARAGIRPGDVILAVNGEKVSSVEQLRALVAKKGKHLALLILRDEQKMFVPVDLG
ncbi:MAG: DegQ family serine endoprotease [Nitrosomonadales bacterium]|nr:DegQ family serine endoprotease [Nitrosomonadales bacterium]